MHSEVLTNVFLQVYEAGKCGGRCGWGQAQAESFDGFVAARWSALFHLARLLCGGDRHRAEDLLQEALVKLWFVWLKVADEAPEAYVRKVLARAAARSARRRWWGERPVEQLPDLAQTGDESAAVVERRTRLEAALAEAAAPAGRRRAALLPGPARETGRGGSGMPAGHRPVPRVTRCGATASDPGRCHRAGGVKGSMDHFERELARMMRDTQEYTPFEPAQQDRLEDSENSSAAGSARRRRPWAPCSWPPGSA